MFKPVDFRNSTKGKMVMVYGPPGTGKSTLAARLAKSLEQHRGAQTCILDFEVGIRDALNQEDCKSTHLFDLSDPLNGMGNQLASFLKQIREKEDVGLVVIDTLGEMCWSLLRGICGTKQPSLPMYGERKRQLKEVLLELRNLTKVGKHVLVLTHQVVGEVDGLPGYYAPDCPKNDRAGIVGQFDFVARVRVANKQLAGLEGMEPGDHFLDFSKDPQQVSKCRFTKKIVESYDHLNEKSASQFVSIATLDDVQTLFNVLN